MPRPLQIVLSFYLRGKIGGKRFGERITDKHCLIKNLQLNVLERKVQINIVKQ